jgi:transposase
MSRVRVRPLRPHEGRKLVRLLRQGKDAIAVRRAEIALRSSQGEPPDRIAAALYFSGDYVRKVIHRFNEEGLDSLKAHYTNGGAPKKLQPEHQSNLIELALTPPNLTGQPFTHWSLQKLLDVATGRKLIPKVSLETVRGVLREHHVSLQRTKTWKQSKDPKFEQKKTPSNASTRRPRPAKRK